MQKEKRKNKIKNKKNNNQTNTQNKKAQTISQVFIFILAGLIFVLIITYGYKAIINFTARSQEIALVDFRNDIETAVETIKYEYGSVRKTELRLPTKYSGICILNIENCPEQPPELILPNKALSLTWMIPACKTGSANIFTVPRSIDLTIPDIIVDAQGFICIPNINGKIIFRLEGLGKKAKATHWN